MKKELSIFEVNEKNIWNYKQNHPELVIKDCKNFGFTDEQLNILRYSMLCRGINKWLKVRRDLIAYKKIIKHKIKKLNNEIIETKELLKRDPHNTNLKKKRTEQKISLKIYEEIRRNLKNMCMTDRYQTWENKKIQDMNTIKCSD